MSSEMRREAAAAEIAKIRRAPISRFQTRINIRFGHFPPGFHYTLAVFILGAAGGIQRGGSGVDQMDKSIRSPAFRLASDYPFHRIRTPVCPHIGKDAGTMVQQLFKQHRNSVERIVFRR